MVRISKTRILEFFQQINAAQTTLERGRGLEDLICYVFEKIPGITVTERNHRNVFNTEEIDIAFWNEMDARGLYFLPHIILVECKNWSQPVGSSEVSWFDTKLRNRGLSFGVLIAAQGITGDTNELTAAHSVIAGALREQRRLIVITKDELITLADTGQLSNLLKKKLCELVVKGTVIQ